MAMRIVIGESLERPQFIAAPTWQRRTMNAGRMPLHNIYVVLQADKRRADRGSENALHGTRPLREHVPPRSVQPS